METTIKQEQHSHMTDDEFFEFCAQNKGLKIERDAEYQMMVMEPTGIYVSRSESSIIKQLGVWNDKNNSGWVTGSNGGYFLPNGAMRVPDAAWISNEQLRKFTKSELEKFIPACPEFIVELMSPSDRLKNAKDKMNEWISNGCHLGFLIYPDEHKVFIYKPNCEVIEKPFTEKISGEDVLPGFELDLSFMLE